MTLQELLKDFRTNLPIIRPKESDFREILFEKLRSYEAVIDFMDVNVDAYDIWGTNDTSFKNRIWELIDGIIKTIDAYYEGNLHKAFTILNRTLNKSDMTNILNKDLSLPKNSNMYRIRLKDV